MKFRFQLQNEQNQRNVGPWKVKLNYLAGKDVPKQFRILPAFGEHAPGEAPDPLSWMPFEDAEGINTPWILFYQVWNNIGHGPWGRAGNRKSFVRFDQLVPGYEFDAVGRVVDLIRNDSEWRYLFDRVQQPGGKTDSILRWYPSQESLANVLVLTNSTGAPEACIGAFSSALTKQLCGGDIGGGEVEEGIINMLSTAPEEYIAQNPMARYWLGDVTDPNMGAVLELFKDTSTNPARFKIRAAKNEKNAVKKIPIPETAMRSRVDLSDISNLLTPPDPQSEVDRLATCLNEWRPDKQAHEYELLAMAFPEFKVPAPPVRGSVNGFVPPKEMPVESEQQAPSYAPSAPVYVPAYAPSAPKAAPAQAPAQAPAYAPAYAPSTPKAAQAPAQAEVGSSATPTTQPGFVPYPAPTSAQAVPTTQEAPANIPGRGVPKFNPAEFLNKVKSKKTGEG